MSLELEWSPDCDAALRAAGERLTGEHPSSGIVAQDPTGAIVGANLEAADLLGLTWDQLLGRTSMDTRWSAVSEVGLPLTGDQHPAMVTLATGQPVASFLMGVMTPVDVGDLGRSLSRTRWIDIDSHPVLASGALVGVVAVFDDVSDTPRGRAASDLQWAAFQLIIQNTQDVIVRTDADGVVRWVSLSVDRVLGWRPADVVGRWLVDLVHPDDRDAVEKLVERVAGIDDEDDSVAAEFRMALPDGTWRWMSDAARVLHDRDLVVSGGLHALRDIADEVAARTALGESEERYRLIAENASDVIVHVRGEHIEWISPSVTATLGGAPDLWEGRDIRSIIHPDDYAAAQAEVVRLSRVDSVLVRVRTTAVDGVFHWVDAHIRQYVGEDGAPHGFIASLRVVDDVVRAEAALERQARYDALTGLMNRAEMMQVVARLVDQDRRSGGEVALLFCDLDRFKDVNDRHGHNAGDEVLRVTGERILAAIRKGDAAARIGGDEVLVVLVGVRGMAEALAVAEKVRAAIREPIPLAEGSVTVSASIGVTLVRPGESGDAMVERADEAMYEAKREGRDRVVAL
jgi:diguanylate cyclase (GGDEF)-like protein/PAS domain S-box-containing protein